MKIETKYNPGDIVFFYNEDNDKVTKGIVDKVRTFSVAGAPTRIVYKIGMYNKEEDYIAETVDELRDKTHTRIDRTFTEKNVYDYAVEQLVQF